MAVDRDPGGLPIRDVRPRIGEGAVRDMDRSARLVVAENGLDRVLRTLRRPFRGVIREDVAAVWRAVGRGRQRVKRELRRPAAGDERDFIATGRVEREGRFGLGRRGVLGVPEVPRAGRAVRATRLERDRERRQADDLVRLDPERVGRAEERRGVQLFRAVHAGALEGAVLDRDARGDVDDLPGGYLVERRRGLRVAHGSPRHAEVDALPGNGGVADDSTAVDRAARRIDAAVRREFPCLIPHDPAVLQRAARLADAGRRARVVRDQAVRDKARRQVDAPALPCRAIALDDRAEKPRVLAADVHAAAMRDVARLVPAHDAVRHRARKHAHNARIAKDARLHIAVAVVPVVRDERMAELGPLATHFHGGGAPVRKAVRDGAAFGQARLDDEPRREVLADLPPVVAVVEERKPLQDRERMVELQAAGELLNLAVFRILEAAHERDVASAFGDNLDGLVDRQERRDGTPVVAGLQEDRVVVHGGCDRFVEARVVAGAVRRDNELATEERRHRNARVGHGERQRRFGGIGRADVARPAEEGKALVGRRRQRDGRARLIVAAAGDAAVLAGRHRDRRRTCGRGTCGKGKKSHHAHAPGKRTGKRTRTFRSHGKLLHTRHFAKF